MVDREMLAAISDLLDQKLEEKLEEKFSEKLQPIYDRLDQLDSRVDNLETDMKFVKVVQLENTVIPRLNTIEACYVDASKRFMERTERIDAMGDNIKVLQSVVANHSKQLNCV